MAAADLKINYQLTRTTGTNVANKAASFGECLTKINKTNSDLKTYWEGQDASKYSKAVEEQAKVMKDLKDTIDEIGKFLVDVGNAYEKAMQANAHGIMQ